MWRGMPGLVRAYKVDGRYLRAESLVSRGVGISCCGCCIVRESESVPVITPPFVEESLVPTVPTGERTITPELKISGHPTSGTAANSWSRPKRCERGRTGSTSASRNITFEYCVRRKTCSFVSTVSRSGRPSKANLWASGWTMTSTPITTSKALLRSLMVLTLRVCGVTRQTVS